MDAAIVTITERAHGVLAFERELQSIEGQISMEQDRHKRQMDVLHTKRQAVDQAIYRLMGG